jgi:hypothetical protein
VLQFRAAYRIATGAPPERFRMLPTRSIMSGSIFALVLAALFVMPALAQPSPQTTRVPTVTRLVKLFSELEAGLVASAHSTDAGVLDRMLDPSFEMRVDSAPGTPIPRDAWMRQLRASTGQPPRIEQMAVHDFGDVAVVSFRETASDAALHPRFVVDCWKRDGDAWKLAVRYLSAAPSSGTKRSAPSKTIDKRY